MADCMMFPNDWHDFLKDYSFIDSEHVYTNGSELIQVFRVAQLIEHLLKEQDAVEPEIEGGGSTWWYVCGECRGAIDKADKFCRHCGREVRRE